MMVVNDDTILLAWRITVRLNFHRNLIAFLHYASAAQVADKLPLLARGANDRALVINDHLQASKVAD